jgi:hypothetical protein
VLLAEIRMGEQNRWLAGEWASRTELQEALGFCWLLGEKKAATGE